MFKKNKNVVLINKPMRIKVKYVQGHFISLTSEFICGIKLLFRFLIFGLVLELWPKNGTTMSAFSVFVVFLFIQPPLTKIQNSKNAII